MDNKNKITDVFLTPDFLFDCMDDVMRAYKTVSSINHWEGMPQKYYHGDPDQFEVDFFISDLNDDLINKLDKYGLVEKLEVEDGEIWDEYAPYLYSVDVDYKDLHYFDELMLENGYKLLCPYWAIRKI